MTRRHLYMLTTVGVFLLAVGVSQAEMLGPSAYLSYEYSPFYSLGSSPDWFYLEDFEDGALNTPGLSVTGGRLLSPSYSDAVDSVDADTGVIDGSGSDGHSWWSGWPNGIASFTFMFDVERLGRYPAYAGLVWTDTIYPGVNDVIFEAFDGDGQSIGVVYAEALGDGNGWGGTSEDRFFGVWNYDGISAMTISMVNGHNFEVDHIQYGYIPEPVSVVALAAGMGLFATRRRR